MISRHHLVEIKCVKELPLSTLSLPHHGLLPRIAVSVRRNHGSPTVSTRVLQHNQSKADTLTFAMRCDREELVRRASSLNDEVFVLLVGMLRRGMSLHESAGQNACNCGDSSTQQ